MKIKLIASAALIGGTLFVCSLVLGTLHLHEPIAGDIDASSAAYAAGFRPGDRIAGAGGRPVATWEEFIVLIGANKGRELEVSLHRTDGAVSQIKLRIPDDGRLEGLTNEYRLPVIGLKAGSPLQRYGIQTGDEVVDIEGRDVTAWRDLDALLQRQDSSRPLNLRFKRGGTALSIAVAPTGHPYSLKGLGIEDPAWYVDRVSSGSLGSHLGVKSMDRILMVQGLPVTADFGASRLRQALKSEKKLAIDVIRGQEVRHLETPRPQIEAGIGDGLEPLFRFLGLNNLSRKSKSPTSGKRDPALWFRYTAYRKNTK